MFTGIIEEIGVLTAKSLHLEGTRLSFMAKRVLEGLEVGDSVAVSGVCLTVVQRRPDGFEADITPETAQRTTLGQLNSGDAVNLERSLRYQGRIGGHLVTGHVDGVGRLQARRQEDNAAILTIELPDELLRHCVGKGSVAVDGVSLTVNEVGKHEIAVAIIPHTAQATTLGVKGVGATVNIETDLIGKYVERLLTADEGRTPNIDLDYLKRKGLL